MAMVVSLAIPLQKICRILQTKYVFCLSQNDRECGIYGVRANSFPTIID